MEAASITSRSEPWTASGSELHLRIRGAGWTDIPAVALKVGVSLAPTVILQVATPLTPRPGMARVRFEHGAFNQAIGVFAAHPYFASAVVDARMMQWLLDRRTETIAIELSDRWIVMHGAQEATAANPEPLRLLEHLAGSARQLPPVVPSLLPRFRDHAGLGAPELRHERPSTG